MIFQIKVADSVPESEVSQPFLQGMTDRMSMSFFKYGKVADAYPRLVDAMASLRIRLERYEATGNTEHLMDLANFAMIEFMCPKHPDAYFQAEDSKKSPGRVWNGEINPCQDSNTLQSK